jgi:uracil-DNA glycosylase family 4
MNEFEKAADFTTESLRKLRETGSNLRGSRESLRALAAARTAAPSPPAAAPAAAPASSPRLVAKPAPPTGEVFPIGDGTREERIERLRGAVGPCVKCPQLASSRTQTVFGVGNIEARIMFVGEAPGADEDLQGEPFVGKAGQLLTKIIETMGVKRADVFIANVLKCRPDMPPGASGNRRPATAEMQTCLPYLRAQIEIIKPEVLVALGSVAMEGLLGSVEPMSRLRGRWHEFQGIPLMATYHPAYLLRNQSLSEKRKVWEDMLLVMERVALPIGEKQRGYFL